MMIKKLKNITILFLMVLPVAVQAEVFWVSGTIERTLSDTETYGGCMVQLSSSVGNNCPANGWVSLDCQGRYSAIGERNYATVLMAFSLNKTISILVDNSKKHDGYCVAKRIDVIN